MNQQQTEAVMAAMEANPELNAAQAVEQLGAQGHPAFVVGHSAFTPNAAGTSATPLDVGPPPGTAVATLPPASTAVATTGGYDPKGLDVGQEDLRVPTMKLRQKMGEVEGDVDVPFGHWFLVNDPETHAPERRVVFLANKRGRAFLLPYDNDKEEEQLRNWAAGQGVNLPDDAGTVCYSTDRHRPVDNGHGTLSESCLTCPHAKWGGQCRENYTFLAYDLTEIDGEPSSMPFILKIRSSGIRPTKTLLTNLKMLGKRHRADICAFEVTMRSVVKKGDKPGQVYAVPVFSRPKLIQDPELVEELASIRDTLWGDA